jgi:hypothetical protein
MSSARNPRINHPFDPQANPLLASPTGRLMAGLAALAHGYENQQVISALLHFTSSLIVTQIHHPVLGRIVDKYCEDLTQLVADKEAALRAAHPNPVANGKKKAKKARAVRRKAASRD